jgi:hypothetical protein
MQPAGICCCWTLKSKRWRVNCIVSRTSCVSVPQLTEVGPRIMSPGRSKPVWNKHAVSGSSFLSNRMWCRQRPCCCLPRDCKQGPDLGPVASYETARGRVRCSRFTCDAVSSSQHWRCSLVLLVVQQRAGTEKGSWSVPLLRSHRQTTAKSGRWGMSPSFHGFDSCFDCNPPTSGRGSGDP